MALNMSLFSCRGKQKKNNLIIVVNECKIIQEENKDKEYIKWTYYI